MGQGPYFRFLESTHAYGANDVGEDKKCFVNWEGEWDTAKNVFSSAINPLNQTIIYEKKHKKINVQMKANVKQLQKEKRHFELIHQQDEKMNGMNQLHQFDIDRRIYFCTDDDKKSEFIDDNDKFILIEMGVAKDIKDEMKIPIEENILEIYPNTLIEKYFKLIADRESVIKTKYEIMKHEVLFVRELLQMERIDIDINDTE
eukprot:285677_1